MKEKAKEEKLIRSTWYLDSVPCPELDLTFRYVDGHPYELPS